MTSTKLYWEIAGEISKELGIPRDVVFFVIKSQFIRIRDEMSKYDVVNRDHPYTDEEDLVYYNFHSLGKLYFNSAKAEKIRNKVQNKIKNETKEN